MKNTVRRIDRALKKLYALDTAYCAELFLLDRRPRDADASERAAVYLRANDSNELSVGIYLDPPLLKDLKSVRYGDVFSVPPKQLDAFSVVTEEVSHFHYLLHHAVEAGRAVSRIELEAQGEIDKFMVSYYAFGGDRGDASALFDALFEKLFVRFDWADHLSGKQRERYLEANDLARRFILSIRPLLERAGSADEALRQLRRFYSMPQLEKEKQVA